MLKKNYSGKSKATSLTTRETRKTNEKGMISFIYRLIWDPAFQDAFIQTGAAERNKLFKSFGLTKKDQTSLLSNDAESILNCIERELTNLLKGVSSKYEKASKN